MKTKLTFTFLTFFALAAWAGELPGWSPASGSGSSGCSSCGGSSGDQLDVGTLLSIDFGPGQKASTIGSLVLRGSFPMPDLATPRGLEVQGGRVAEVELRYDPFDNLRQISTPRLLIDISTNTPYKYTIRVMKKAAQGSLDSGFYEWNSDPQYLLRQYTVENPDASPTTYNRLQIKDVTSGTVEWMFVYSTTISGWTVTLPGNLGSLDLISTNHASTAWTMIKRYRNPADQVIAVHSQVFTNLVWGTAMLSDTRGTGAEARTKRMTYYEDADSAGYTPSSSTPARKTVEEPDGTWSKVMSYDSEGRVLVEHSGIDTGVTNDDSQCRKVVYSYASQDGEDDLSREPNSPRKIEEYWKNTLIRRTYHVYTADSHRTVTCPNPANAIDNAENLVTEDTYQSGTARILRTTYPDGTASIPVRVVAQDGTETVTTDRGEYDSLTMTVLNGTRTEDITSPAGTLISNRVWRLDGGDLGVQTENTIYSNFNEFDRPQRVDYLSGLYETMTYACCGLESKTDTDGVTTTYGYDVLGRQVTATRLGITLENVFDAAGRIVEKRRIGTDSSVIRMAGFAYDTSGFMVHETNALVGVTSYIRDKTAAGYDRITTTNQDGGTRIVEINGEGIAKVTGTAAAPTRRVHGIATTSYNGSSRTLYYDGEIKLDPAYNDTSEAVTNCSDGLGRGIKVMWPNSAAAYTYYNNNGQQVRSVDADGVTTLFRYNAEGQLEVTAVDMNRDGAIDDYDSGHSGSDRVTRTVTTFLDTGASGNTRGMPIRKVESLVWTTPNSSATAKVRTVESSLDGLHAWSTTYKDQSTPVTTSSETTLPSSGSRSTTTIAPGGSYTVSAYSYGRLVSATRYDALDNQLSSIGYSYDAHGRQYQSTDARNGTTTYGYNNADQVATNTTPNPGGGSPETTVTSYNNMMQLTSVTQPDGTTVNSVYLLTGELGLQYGSRTYPVAYSYDYAGRMKTMTNWSNFATSTGARVTTWGYDANRGFPTSKTYDGGAAGPSYTYTSAGRLQTRAWARGITTTYNYDNGGSLYTVSYSDSTPGVTYTYDRQGRQSTIVCNDMTDTLAYNLANELLGESFSGGTLDGLSVTNGYDQFLRRTNLAALQSNNPFIQQSFGYDAASRLSTVSDGNNNLATNTYLANSPLVSQITFKNGSATRMTTSKSYDYLNRLTAISSVGGASSASPISFNYNYNPANQRTKDTLVDGNYWIYGYDSLGQVTNGCKYFADGTPVAGQQFGYTFDTIGNRTQTKSGGDQNGGSQLSANYSANSLNQITSRDVPAYVDVKGVSIATNTVTVNGQTAYRKGEYFRKELPANNSSSALWMNIIVAATGQTSVTGNVYVAKQPETFSYDADGNLTNDGRWSYTWDGENRLTNMTSLATAPAGSKLKLDFAYDTKGRRIQKIVSTNDGSAYIPQSTNRFVYDGWNLIAVLSPSSQLLSSYTWGNDLSGSMQGAGGVGGLVEVSYYGSSTTNCFAAYDGNGNVAALVNVVDGTALVNYEYGPFGEVIRATGPMAKVNPFRWSTKYQDDESDLLYYGYRYYKPSAGTWPNRDPIGESGGGNLYACFKNNPVSEVDLNGHITVTRMTKDLKSTCGSAEVKFWIKLDKPAEQDGYIVQENTVDIPWLKGFIHGNIWHDHYWEAWFVKKGETSPTTDSAAKYTDHVSWDGECGAVGSGGIQGTLKFFFASKARNLGNPGANPPTSPDPSSGWTPQNSAPGSQDLPSTRNPRGVPWWNDPSDNGEASATRSVTVSWDCSCKCEKDKSTISASP